MKTNTQLFLDEKPVEIIAGKFPDGACYARFTPPQYSPQTMRIRLTAMKHMADLMILAQLVEAVHHQYSIRQSILDLPYLPYARQDRHMQLGDSFALEVFGNLLNTLAFDQIRVLDPHSIVAYEVIKNLSAISQTQCIMQNAHLSQQLMAKEFTLVAPDAGALKKIHQVAEQYALMDYIVIEKQRDIVTGDLSGFKLLSGDASHKNLLIVDDLCDGGGTFIGAAKVLRQAGAKSISLYVTHGIFSKGIDHLLTQGIDHIYTTTSYASMALAGPQIELIDINTIYAQCAQ